MADIEDSVPCDEDENDIRLWKGIIFVDEYLKELMSVVHIKYMDL